MQYHDDDLTGSGQVQDASAGHLLHELNQPLTAITNYARAGSYMIANGEAPPARLKELFDKIIAQCDRTYGISRQLGNAVRGAPADKERG